MRPLFALLLLAAAICHAAELTTIEISGVQVENLTGVYWDRGLTTFLPGYSYNSNFTVFWAIPNSALSNINASTVPVHVQASAPENSSIFFNDSPNPKSVSFTLICHVSNGECASNSTLSKTVQFHVLAASQMQYGSSINITSSLENSPEEAQLTPENILSSLGRSASNYTAQLDNITQLFNPTPSQGEKSQGEKSQTPGSGIGGFFTQSQSKPQSSSGFVLENPLVTIAALAIVVIITGAYLLKNKD